MDKCTCSSGFQSGICDYCINLYKKQYQPKETTMDKKYLLMPGYINSRNDGDRHYINAKALVDLYQVKGRECITYVPGKMDPKMYARLIKLYPRYDGIYEHMGVESNDIQ